MFIDTNDLCDAVLFDRDIFRLHLPIGKTLLIFGKNKQRSIVQRCGS
jgi:hypothetical protein